MQKWENILLVFISISFVSVFYMSQSDALKSEWKDKKWKIFENCKIPVNWITRFKDHHLWDCWLVYLQQFIRVRVGNNCAKMNNFSVSLTIISGAPPRKSIHSRTTSTSSVHWYNLRFYPWPSSFGHDPSRLTGRTRALPSGSALFSSQRFWLSQFFKSMDAWCFITSRAPNYGFGNCGQQDKILVSETFYFPFIIRWFPSGSRRLWMNDFGQAHCLFTAWIWAKDLWGIRDFLPF